MFRIVFALTVVVLLTGIQPASAKRVALVIGNSAYQHVPALANPKNDAEDIAARLKAIGFDVIDGRDLTLIDLRRTIRAFINALSDAELGLFYYAGHGLQVNGRNYLAPVDARLESYDDLDFEAFPIETVLAAMERKTKTNLVFLDACRNNPLARNLARSMGTRSTDVGRGLARISSGVGTLISFSTQPGNVALDGDGRNSPFTSALVKHLGTPGEDITRSLRKVRNDVLTATSGKQVPWENSSLTGDVVLVERSGSAQSAAQSAAQNAAQGVAQPAPGPAPAGDASTQVEIAYWNSIKDADSAAFFQSYLAKYPNGVFADLARLKIAEIEESAGQESQKQQTAEKPVNPSSTSQDNSQKTAVALQTEPVSPNTDQIGQSDDSEETTSIKVAVLTPDNPKHPFANNDTGSSVAKPSLAAQNYERAKKVGTERGWQLFIRKHGADRLYGPLALQQLGLASATGDRDARNAEVEDYLALGRSGRMKIQTALNERGFDGGAADGVFGPKTRGAIRDFQLSSEVSNTGYVDHTLLELLNIRLSEFSDETFTSGEKAKIYNADDLEALGEDKNVVNAIRCLLRTVVIYGRYQGKTYVAVRGGIGVQLMQHRAEQCGGHLVAINSAAENRFVYDLIASDNQYFKLDRTSDGRASFKHGPIIGLVQKPGSGEPRGGWQWANGDRITYSNWERYNPDNFEGNQNLGSFFVSRNGKVDMSKVRADKWGDESGNWSTGVIVEFD